MQEYGLQEPEFRDMEIGFRINLYRNTEDSKLQTNQETNQELPTDQETSQEYKEKASNRKIVMEAIRNNPSITQKQLESITGLSRSGVRYILRKLQEENILQRVGATKKGQWVFTKNN